MTQLNVKQAMLALIESIEDEPKKSKVFFKAETRLVEGVRCEAKVRQFPALIIDEPPVLGGEDKGQNPVELVLAALGTCQEIMYSAYASVMDIPLESVTVKAKGNLDLKGLLGLDSNVPAGYTDIQYQTEITSSADREQIEQLVKTAESHCPVLDILTRQIDVSGTVSHNGIKL